MCSFYPRRSTVCNWKSKSSSFLVLRYDGRKIGESTNPSCSWANEYVGAYTRCMKKPSEVCNRSRNIFFVQNFVMSPDNKFIAICGKDGNIHILSAVTKEWIANLNMGAGDVVDVTFNNDGSRMFSFNGKCISSF